MHENRLQIFAVIPVELAESEDCDFSCIKLALQKISVSHINTNLAKRLTPYFDRCCDSLPQTSFIIFVPEILRVFELFCTFEKQKSL